MQELTFEQVEEVSGGVIPLIVAIVAIDAGLQATMWSYYMSQQQ